MLLLGFVVLLLCFCLNKNFDDEGIHAHSASRLAKLPRNILEATYAFANRNIKDWDLWVDEWQSAAAGGGSVPAGELVAPSCGCEPAAAAVAAPASPESLGTAESAAAAPASSSEVSAAVAWAVASAADAGSRACDPLDSWDSWGYLVDESQAIFFVR